MNIPKFESIILTNNTENEIGIDVFEDLFRIVINGESRPSDSFINLVLSDDGSIRQLNKKYLGRDEITDVLSFTADIPGINLIGDIIIDTNSAIDQKDDRTLVKELQILFLHGLLHCLDYDHLAEKDKIVMVAKEKEYQSLLIKENG